jgi:hypothetical protein
MKDITLYRFTRKEIYDFFMESIYDIHVFDKCEFEFGTFNALASFGDPDDFVAEVKDGMVFCMIPNAEYILESDAETNTAIIVVQEENGSVWATIPVRDINW